MQPKTHADMVPQLTRYREWLNARYDHDFADYEAMRRWSVDDIAAFWQSVWTYCELQSPTPIGTIVSGAMPTATWFDGASVNYASEVFRHADAAEAAGQPAIIAQDENGHVVEIGWHELRRRTASLALELRRRGIGRGDRVAAYLPNISEAAIGLLACASLGAIWTLCSPDMGTPAVLDRFGQVTPRALIAVDHVVYGGKVIDRSQAVADLRRALPDLVACFLVGGRPDALHEGWTDFADACARDDGEVARFQPEWLPFEHPLWILYSSGTTGLPKAIVHGHGGVIVTGCVGNMHLDIGPSYAPDSLGERFFWYSATGWVMWNVQIGGLLSGTTICLFDGSPGKVQGRSDWSPLWAFAARHRITWFGAGAAFFISCRHAGLAFGALGDLGAIRALGTTGSVLPGEVQTWVDEEFAGAGHAAPWWCNISGGTDIAAAFLSGNRELPPAPGKLQCRHLGAAIEAWNAAEQPVVGELGELVCVKPFPSMPLYFWADEDGARYRASYFEDWPGVWRHGDWLRIDRDGTCTITGRSDATINRHGLRMGTSEIYAAVLNVAGVEDSLVIDIDAGEGDSELLMFVKLDGDQSLSAEIEQAMCRAIRGKLSPRFVPDVFVAAPAIPRTLSGKKQEIPVKRLFQGFALSEVMSIDSVENPQVMAWYVTQAETWIDRQQNDAVQGRRGERS